MTKPTSPAKPISAVALGDALTDDAGLVTIARLGSPMEAEIVRGLLATAEIPVFVADLETAAVAPHLSYAMGGLRVQVPAWAEDEARELLGAARGSAFAPTREEEEPGPLVQRVPRRSTEVGAVLGVTVGAAAIWVIGVPGPLWAVVAMAVAASLGALFGRRQITDRCSGCGRPVAQDAEVCRWCHGRFEGPSLEKLET